MHACTLHMHTRACRWQYTHNQYTRIHNIAHRRRFHWYRSMWENIYTHTHTQSINNNKIMNCVLMSIRIEIILGIPIGGGGLRWGLRFYRKYGKCILHATHPHTHTRSSIFMRHLDSMRLRQSNVHSLSPLSQECRRIDLFGFIVHAIALLGDDSHSFSNMLYRPSTTRSRIEAHANITIRRRCVRVCDRCIFESNPTMAYSGMQSYPKSAV